MTCIVAAVRITLLTVLFVFLLSGVRFKRPEQAAAGQRIPIVVIEPGTAPLLSPYR
jgi:hypothetical protein